VLSLAGAPAAQAATYVPAFTFKNTTETYRGGPFLLGYRFSTNFDKAIKAIGVYKSIKSPPNNSLGIWKFDRQMNLELLFQTVITTQGDCTGDFCWHPASDFLPNALPAIEKDTMYAIATIWGEEEVPAMIKPSDVTIVYPGFSVGDNAYFSSPLNNLNEDLTGIAPDVSDTVTMKSFFTANLSFETYGTVKTPSPLPLIGAAAAFGWSRKIRRRINTSS
jgi:hypothetical protein